MNIRLTFPAFVLLASSVNALAQDAFESRPPSVRPPDPEEGIVVVSLATNSLKLDGVDTLIVDGEPSSYRLRSLTSAYARDYALFVGVLPEGRYSIRAIEERDAFRTLTLALPDREMIGPFEVKRGQRCDLGRLVVTQFTLDLVMGRDDRNADNEAALLRFAPDSAKLLPPATPCWVKPRDLKDIIAPYARIFPADGAVAVELAGGRVAVPTGMGSLMIRGTDGRWAVAHGESVEQLLYVDDAPDGSVVAVGALNTLVKLGADGKLHRLDAGELPLGNILFIDGNPKDGWHIVHQRATDLRILHSPSLDAPAWTEIASAATGVSFWSGARNFWVWPTANGFAYATTDKGLMRFYDYATKTWTERHTPKNNAIIAIAPSPNGVIGVVTSPGGGLGGITASQYISRDGGQTWEEPPTSPYKVKVSPPRMLADGTLLINGGVFGDAGLHASKDGGKTWSMMWDRMDVGDFYWNLPRAGLINFSKGRDGIEVISHSGNGGKTWETEYMSVDVGMLKEHFKALDEAEKARKEAKKAAQAKKKKN